MLKSRSMITLLFVITGLICACPAWAVDVNRLKISPPPVVEQGDQSDVPQFWSFYIETYDENGPQAKWQSIPGGPALQLAAQDYALLTGDYDVSLKDVVDNGLWPFNTFPPDINLEDRLYGFDGFQCGIWDPEKKQPMGPEPGSTDWWIHERAVILDDFYNYYYFTIIDLEHERTAEPGPRYAAFWTNPATGQPMVESEEYGDYWQCELALITPVLSIGDTNYLSAELLPDVDTILAALQTAPIKPDGQGHLQLDLSSLGLGRGTVMTFWNADESKIRSRETAESLARSEVRSKLEAAGKLSFDFRVSRINTISLHGDGAQ